MDRQLSVATLDYAGKKKRTKRDVFLAELMATVAVVSAGSSDRAALSEAGLSGGRRSFSIAMMLRIYCLRIGTSSIEKGATLTDNE